MDSGLGVTLSTMTDLDVPTLFAQGIAAFWWAIPLAILWFVVDTTWFKGKLGEFLVARSFKKHLDPDVYTVLHDVTLPVRDGTTQIDHIVISVFGIFVIETKNMSGWIFGSPKDRQWTQTFRRKKFRFQNPLRQNFKHVKAVAEVTGLPEQKLHSLVIFTGSAKFKTRMPANVTRRAAGVWYVRTQRDPILSDAEVHAAVSGLKDGRLKPGATTNRAHIQSTQTRRSEPLCPLCGSSMVKRTTRKGPNADNQFWGCSEFPKCRGTRPLTP